MHDHAVDTRPKASPAAVSHPPAHDKHAGHRPDMFRDRLVVSLLLTVPILYLSEHFQSWFGFRSIEFPGDSAVTPIAATILFFYAGLVFIRGSVSELRHRVPGMMTLISLAIAVSYGYSLAVTLGLDGEPFYWELATLLDVMLLGHWMEMRSVVAASRALDDLASMVPSVAHRLEPDVRLRARGMDSPPPSHRHQDRGGDRSVGVLPSRRRRD